MTDVFSERATGMRSRGLLALAAAALLPFLATGAAAQSWDEIVAAAKREGEITVYTGTSRPILDKEIEAFNAKYPEIKFSVLEGEAADLSSRIDQEAASGAQVADLYVAVDSKWILDANKRGLVAPLTGPSAKAWPAEYRTEDSYKMALQAGGIVVNTDLVKRPINGYEDLVGDEFKNGMLGEKQWSNITSAPFHTYLETNHPGLADKLSAQKLTIYRSSEAGTSSVAAGELAAVLWSAPAVPKNLIAQGAPIAFVIPDKAFGMAILVNVFEGAPHKNAAQLFADFLLSEEGQKIWNSEGSAQASPLGFGDVSPSSIVLLDPNAWTDEQIAEQKALWNKRFGG